MAEYLGQRIIDNAYTYNFIVGRRPDLKSGIDNYLKEKDKEDLMVIS